MKNFESELTKSEQNQLKGGIPAFECISKEPIDGDCNGAWNCSECKPGCKNNCKDCCSTGTKPEE